MMAENTEMTVDKTENIVITTEATEMPAPKFCTTTDAKAAVITKDMTTFVMPL